MNTIATFFVGIMTSVSSLFGSIPQPSNETAVMLTKQGSVQQEAGIVTKKTCKDGMSCSFCKNGSYTEWDSKISDGGVTYYDSKGSVITVVGGMKSDGNATVKKFNDECEEVE